ncbi:hypothetical protein BUALT_BualtUnG0015800 [Buddleja alternifolia]|uniref:Tr-type G domain-containing protein n=1 Tax=Buddleja alternifolia TaxID=168488 RepID=A0AAV6W7I2_9LAMI|nr:hypothetical protein BUALT_BualtUnG0015800 [Buddleja alternifolia]
MDDSLYETESHQESGSEEDEQPLERPTLDDPQPYASSEYLSMLMCDPDSIRSVALVGHLSHGKTTFMDMLVEQTHRISTFDENSKKHMRYTDTREDEQERGISIKAVPMSLALEASNPIAGGDSIFYLCNIMDTPGHLDFSDEMTAALRLADGAVLIVDAAEGVLVSKLFKNNYVVGSLLIFLLELIRLDFLCLENIINEFSYLLANTERAIRHAIQKRIAIVVVINKLDRLITELKLPPRDAYFKLRHTIEVINNHITDASSTDGNVQAVDPVIGNVCFASATDGWSFTLKSYATRYVEFQDTPLDADTFASGLWGDYYFHPTTKTFENEQPAGGAELSFVDFVLQPLYNIYKQYSGRLELKLNCSLILGGEKGLTDMLFNHIPSVKDSAPRKLEHIYMGPKDSTIYQSMKDCDASGPLMVNITKLYPKSDCSAFDALGRVYSGELVVGRTVRVFGGVYSPNAEILKEEVTKLWVYQAHYRVAIRKAPPGCWVLIEGVDNTISKDATLCNDVHVFRRLQFNTLPVVGLSFETLNPNETGKLQEGLMKIYKSYPSVKWNPETHTILGTGVLYLDCITKDLRELYSKVKLKVEGPFVSLAETVTAFSAPIISSEETTNKELRISMTAEPLDPLETGLAEDIEYGVVSIDSTQKKQGLCHWGRLTKRCIWSFGSLPGHLGGPGPNILSYDMGSNINNLHKRLEDYIAEGFQWAALKGPLCNEPIRNANFNFVDAQVLPGSLVLRDVELIQIIKNMVFSTFLMAEPRLMEPVYYVEVSICIKMPENYVDATYKELSRRRGHSISDNAQLGAEVHIVKAFLPVVESFGLETYMNSLTQGQAFCSLVFHHWTIVPGDPLDKKTIPNLARKLMENTRHRKGMSQEVSIKEVFNEAMLLELVRRQKDFKNESNSLLEMLEKD